jgi:DNA-binding LytR/AlgR family response regulator
MQWKIRLCQIKSQGVPKVKIAICDDIPAQLDLLEAAVHNCPVWSGEPLSVKRFSNGRALLRDAGSGQPYSFIFLDIQMPEISGLKMYGKLARNGTSVIFVSTHIELLPETHALHAPGFLPKPYTQETFDRTVKSVIAQRAETQFFTYYDDDRNKQLIPCRDIYYFSTGNHFVYAHTADGKVSAYGESLKDMENRLLPFGFYRCSNRHIVNLMYCDHRRGNKIVFKHISFEDEISISKRKLQEYDRQYLRFKWR